MAKIHLDRLIDQFDFSADEVTGLNYQSMMKDMIANRTLNIGRATGRISKGNYERQLQRIKKKGIGREKIIVFPDVTEALPKRSVFVNKAAQDGKLINDTLRDRLTGDLRRSLIEFRTKKTDEPAFIRRRGAKAGTINPKLIDQFQRSIVQTYSTYARRDPSIGVPTNVRAIAITEIRSTVDNMKATYNKKLAEENRDTIVMTKTWIQNKNLSKVPRRGHMEVHGERLPFDHFFLVPLYVEEKGVQRLHSTTPMLHPHDPAAPASQVIHCSCEAVYKAILR